MSVKSLNATTENIKKAVEYMDNLSGGGGTELLNALKTAMNLNTSDEFSRSFVILTDGYVSVEKETFDYIKNNLGNANFFPFGIGSSVNRFIIEGMAHVGMGEPFIAINRQEAAKQAEKMLKYVSSPILTQIKYDISSLDAYDLLPEQIPDLFASRPIIITGKYKGPAGGDLVIQGTTGNTSYKNAIHIKKTGQGHGTKALKYLWAREQIRLFADYNNLSSDTKTKEKIIELGKKYNLLTEFTSFIAIDTEISNTKGGSATVKQPLPLPEGVSNNAIGKSFSKPGRTYGMNKHKSSSYYAGANANYELTVDKEEEDFAEAEVFQFVEFMPRFQGGDISNFQKYVQSKLEYPGEAIEKGLQGNVIISFVIDKKGHITNIKVIRGVHQILDEAALKAVKSSPRWTPGKQRGQPVNVMFTIPVRFSLQ